MIISIGVDIVEIDRIERAFDHSGDRFRDRVFTEVEIAYCEQLGSRLASYAARFAAKEAVMKALGTGWSEGIGWKDIEVSREDKGPPVVRLSGRAQEVFEKLGANRIHVSLSHSRGIAMAQVVLESA